MIDTQFSATLSGFSFARAAGAEALDDIFALRFRVYCEERKLIDSREFPSTRERDEYDDRSLHFRAAGHDGSLLGTVRLVRSSSLRFPLERYCAIPANAFPNGTRESTAEISRLAISKARIRETLRNGRSQASRPNVVLGLFKVMYQESKREGITHWLAAMEPSLIRLLNHYHIPFKPIGPQIDYHGWVTPCLARVSDIEANIHRHCPEFLAQFFKGLEPEYLPPAAELDSSNTAAIYHNDTLN